MFCQFSCLYRHFSAYLWFFVSPDRWNGPNMTKKMTTFQCFCPNLNKLFLPYPTFCTRKWSRLSFHLGITFARGKWWEINVEAQTILPLGEIVPRWHCEGHISHLVRDSMHIWGIAGKSIGFGWFLDMLYLLGMRIWWKSFFWREKFFWPFLAKYVFLATPRPKIGF